MLLHKCKFATLINHNVNIWCAVCGTAGLEYLKKFKFMKKSISSSAYLYTHRQKQREAMDEVKNRGVWA